MLGAERKQVNWLFTVIGYSGPIVKTVHWLAALTVGRILVFPLADAAEKTVDFNRDIRPILANNCFQCHGPDEEARKARLRLDVRKSAVEKPGVKAGQASKATGSGQGPDPVRTEAAIVPGQPDASQLIRRILEDDPDERMPPAKTRKTISKREALLLRKWIEEGAEYAGHWAFQAIKKYDLPGLKDESWAKNGIDHFILSRMEEKGIEPSPEADPPTLIRRMYIDLIGLLPDPERVTSFVTEFEKDADSAVAELADELLSNPHYGERWGRHWLDQARYADSNGYTIDGERIMWPYRDWVIRAMNDDMPFDQFTIEQLAGDLLKHPDKRQLIASGFHRNTLINQEGGTDDEQFRNEEVVDRVNTTGSVWLALTVGCAQCHAHKFDPVSQKEYYQLFAFFNQGVDVNNTGRTVEVSEGELFLKENAKLAAFEAARAKMADLRGAAPARQKEWEKQRLARGSAAKTDSPMAADWKPAELESFFAEGGAPMKRLADGSILVGQGAAREVYRVTMRSPEKGGLVAAVRLRLIPDPSLPAGGPGRAGNGNFVVSRVEFFMGKEGIPVLTAQADHSQPGFSAALTIDGKSDTGWAINIGKGSRPGVKMNAPHQVEYIFAEPVRLGADPLEIVLRHEVNNQYNIGRFALDVSATSPPPPPTDEEKLLAALKIDPEKRDKTTRTLISTEFAKTDQPLVSARIQVERLRKQLGLGPTVKTMVMSDLPEKSKRKTYLHIRGDFLRDDKESGPLTPDVPAVFPEMEDHPAHPSRLNLARWLMQEDHPLTARVRVNRVWMRFFGKGLVVTDNDFGTQGSFPTHPKLLDWLAVRFREDGWSLKKLQRLIVTSATYRQASKNRRDLAEIDPLNLLLARMSRIRFDAEIVRDSALSVSGLLSEKLGGPGVTPPQPDGVYSFTQRKVQWATATGPDRFRRAIYIKFYRSAPYPLLTTFDSPDFQSVCTARARSNTPLQSLAQANDGAMFELAQGLAERLMREVPGTGSASERSRLRRACELCYSRPPAGDEVEILAAYVDRQRADFQQDPSAAQAVAPSNWKKKLADNPGRQSVADAAAWVSLARALMNTDEFITRE